MRATILQHLVNAGAGLDPFALQALEKLQAIEKLQA